MVNLSKKNFLNWQEAWQLVICSGNGIKTGITVLATDRMALKKCSTTPLL